jgi:hypothetical protein
MGSNKTSSSPAKKARATRLRKQIAAGGGGAKAGAPRSPRDFVEEKMREEPRPKPRKAKAPARKPAARKLKAKPKAKPRAKPKR